VFVKICGIRDPAALEAAVEGGAAAVGFVLTDSPRQVTADRAAQAMAMTPADVLTVAVLGRASVAHAAHLTEVCGARAVQLHGDHSRADFAAMRRPGLTLIRGTSAERATTLEAGAYGEDVLLLDAPRAGSGARWHLAVLRGRRPAGRWLLAGGLDANNVVDAIAAARPWGVDVSSGVESARGVKDPAQIRRFLEAVARAPSPA